MASNTGYTLNTNKWFLGQVPDNQNQFVKNSIWDDTHADRVKVRIPSMHPMSGKDSTSLLNDDLPWAIVAKPTTHGNRNYQSSGIWGGEWVIGFFMDEDCQIPVITQVLGNNLTEYELTESINGTTQGKRVTRYNSGLGAGAHQVLGATSAKSPVDISKTFFDRAKTS